MLVCIIVLERYGWELKHVPDILSKTDTVQNSKDIQEKILPPFTESYVEFKNSSCNNAEL